MAITITATDISGVTTVKRDASTNGFTIDANGIVSKPSRYYIVGTPWNGTQSTAIANNFAVQQSSGLTQSGGAITIQVAGLYHICYSTISGSNSGRYDAGINVNGGRIVNLLNEDNGSGYHQKTGTITQYLNVNDVITFDNSRWYNTSGGYDQWQTASIVLIG
jgi:hypothetical protein